MGTNIYPQHADPTNPDTWHHYNLNHVCMVISCDTDTTILSSPSSPAPPSLPSSHPLLSLSPFPRLAPLHHLVAVRRGIAAVFLVERLLWGIIWNIWFEDDTHAYACMVDSRGGEWRCCWNGTRASDTHACTHARTHTHTHTHVRHTQRSRTVSSAILAHS